MERWIRIDEAADVAGSIRHALRSAQFVHEDPLAWKWVGLALHSALQGACVCHLTTSAAPIGAVPKKNARESLRYLEDRRADPEAKPPTTNLMSLPELLKAVRKPHSAGDRGHAAGLKISDGELQWLCRFHNEFRNPFAHFEPMAWSIEVSGIPEIAVLAARIIGDIHDYGYAFRHQDDAEKKDMRANLRSLASTKCFA